MFNTEEEAQAHVDRQIAEAQEHARKAQGVLAQMEAIRATGRSADGAIEVVLGRTGGLVDVRVGDAAVAAGPDAVRRGVLEANGAAQNALIGQVTAIADSAYGEDSDTAREFANQYRNEFPPPPEQIRPDPEIGR